MKVERYILQLVMLLALALGLPSSSAAQSENTFSFEIYSVEPIVEARGFILKDPEAGNHKLPADTYTRKTTVAKKSPNRWGITVTLKPEDHRSQRRISVAAKTTSGNWIPGSVHWIVKPQYVPSRAVSCLENKAFESLKDLNELSEEELELIVRARQIRQRMLEKNLEVLLTPELLEKLVKEEKELGLHYDLPLTQELSLQELAERVGKIRALKSPGG